MTSTAVCVVGLGKIGLALAAQYASRGLRVHGADINAGLVDSINSGTPPVDGEDGLEERLSAAAQAGLIDASTDTTAAVRSSDVVVVAVPLLVDDAGTPLFSALDAATEAIAAGLRPGTTVIYETTLPVSTTRQRFAPVLAERSGLTLGHDLFVAFSPERVYVGRVFADLRRYPKLVGGIDEASTKQACAFYEAALEFDPRDDLPKPNGVWDLGTAEAAELAKLAETTYRDINIGFANELARFAESNGIDVFKVIEASNSQPFSHIHLPGVAVGGHCIPVYPRLYLSNDPTARVPAAAREANLAMPAHVVARLDGTVGPLASKRVAVLGAAYRGAVKETAFSGVFPLVEELRARGAVPLVHDPLYTDEELRALGFEPYRLGEHCDAAIVQADHEMYRVLTASDLPGITALVDGRRITSPDRWPGVVHLQVGVASDPKPTG